MDCGLVGGPAAGRLWSPLIIGVVWSRHAIRHTLSLCCGCHALLPGGPRFDRVGLVKSSLQVGTRVRGVR